MKRTQEKGITIVAVVITVIVLLILATITIGGLTGDNGVIQQAKATKEQAEINSEIKVVETSAHEVRNKDKYGEVKNTEENKELQTSLDTNAGDKKTTVSQVEGKDVYTVTFTESKRVYSVDGSGNVEYVGKMDDLSQLAIITASPTQITVPRKNPTVTVTVSTLQDTTDDKVKIEYVWTKNKDEDPKPSDYKDAEIKDDGKTSKNFPTDPNQPLETQKNTNKVLL